jgi:hypothetical protein
MQMEHDEKWPVIRKLFCVLVLLYIVSGVVLCQMDPRFGVNETGYEMYQWTPEGVFYFPVIVVYHWVTYMLRW